MTAEDLYAELKDALKFFGLGWGDKDAVKITLDGTVIVFSHDRRQCRVDTDAARYE